MNGIAAMLPCSPRRSPLLRRTLLALSMGGALLGAAALPVLAQPASPNAAQGNATPGNAAPGGALAPPVTPGQNLSTTQGQPGARDAADRQAGRASQPAARAEGWSHFGWAWGIAVILVIALVVFWRFARRRRGPPPAPRVR